jgi:hypothetical protein
MAKLTPEQRAALERAGPKVVAMNINHSVFGRAGADDSALVREKLGIEIKAAQVWLAKQDRAEKQQRADVGDYWQSLPGPERLSG